MGFGAETMEDGDLARIGRPGSVSETVTAVARARGANYQHQSRCNVWTPGPTSGELATDTGPLPRTGPDPPVLLCPHRRKRSKTCRQHSRRQSPEPDEGLQIKMDEAAQRILGDAGYNKNECPAMPSLDMPVGIICSIGPMANTLDAARAHSPISTEPDSATSPISRSTRQHSRQAAFLLKIAPGSPRMNNSAMP